MKTINEEIRSHAIEGLKDKGEGVLGCELHNTLFNEDYFVIGYYNAEKFLKECEDGIFGAIEIIKDYEKDHFGEVSTDFSSSEKVANMYAYIKGEELLSESSHLLKCWDDELSEDDVKKIIEELENA